MDRKKIFLIGAILMVAVIGLLSYLIAGKLIPKSKPASGPNQTVPDANRETSFTLTTSALNFSVGDEVRVTVLVRSDSDAANLFVSRLKFPADLLEARSINLQPQGGGSFIKDWFITNWVENAFDNTTGSASLVGGVPSPGFKTTAGQSPVLAELIFRAKKAGSVTVSFDNTSAIYRNSDNANILILKREISFKINPLAGEPAPIPSTVLGDLNGDGRADLADLSVILTRFGKNGKDIADLNSDLIINSFDYSAEIRILAEATVILQSDQSASGSARLN